MALNNTGRRVGTTAAGLYANRAVIVSNDSTLSAAVLVCLLINGTKSANRNPYFNFHSQFLTERQVP